MDTVQPKVRPNRVLAVGTQQPSSKPRPPAQRTRFPTMTERMQAKKQNGTSVTPPVSARPVRQGRPPVRSSVNTPTRNGVRQRPPTPTVSTKSVSRESSISNLVVADVSSLPPSSILEPDDVPVPIDPPSTEAVDVNPAAVYGFTNRTAGASYLCNDHECTVMIDGKMFYHVIGYMMYYEYMVRGDLRSAEHIRAQKSAVYCRLYWVRNPVPCADGMDVVIQSMKSSMLRAVLCKFVCYRELADKLCNDTSNCNIEYKCASNTLRSSGAANTICVDEAEHSYLGTALRHARHVITFQNSLACVET